MPDSAPRGFARIPSDLVNLYGWVLAVGGGCGLLGQVGQFTSLRFQHSASWSPPIPAAQYAFYLAMLPATAVSLVAGLLLLRRWRCSVVWILAALALTVLAQLSAGVDALWPLLAPTPAQQAYSGPVFDFIQGAQVMTASGAAAVALVLIAWLWRFRGEVLAPPAGEGEPSAAMAEAPPARLGFGPIPADVVDLYARCLLVSGFFGLLAALANASAVHVYMVGRGPHGVQGPPGVPGALFDLMLLPGALVALVASAGLFWRRRWALGWVLCAQALAVLVAAYQGWMTLGTVSFERFEWSMPPGRASFLAAADAAGRLVVAALVLAWLWRLANRVQTARRLGAPLSGVEAESAEVPPRGFARLGPGVLALLGWGVLAGGLIGALAQLPRLAWAVQTVLPGYFPRSAEVDWECLRAALYCLVWAGAAVAGPGLRWRRRWSLDLLLAVGVAYLLVTAAATIVAAGGWAGAHGELPWPASLPPYPYCVLPLTGVALKAGLACLALFWLWRFRREFSLPPSAPD